jgi:hypothetical protein
MNDVPSAFFAGLLRPSSISCGMSAFLNISMLPL